MCTLEIAFKQLRIALNCINLDMSILKIHDWRLGLFNHFLIQVVETRGVSKRPLCCCHNLSISRKWSQLLTYDLAIIFIDTISKETNSVKSYKNYPIVKPIWATLIVQAVLSHQHVIAYILVDYHVFADCYITGSYWKIQNNFLKGLLFTKWFGSWRFISLWSNKFVVQHHSISFFCYYYFFFQNSKLEYD